MASEAFALSPMSARAAEPNEQDYDAIREAFMETARGRWFLGEFAKRNRNADTSMVLDAVAKIEETLAAQRQPVVEDRLPEALVEIRRAIREAETIAIAAFDPAAIEASLAAIPRGVRIIKEISWRWREIGADGRICDLIDSQLASIEAACAQVSIVDPRADLKVAFDLLRNRVEQTDADGSAVQPSPAPVREPPPPVAEAPTVEAAAATASEPPVAFTEEPQDAAIAPELEAVVETTGAADAMSVAEDALDVAIEPEIAESQVEVEVTVEESFAAVEESLAEPAAVAEITDEFSLDATAEAEDDAVLARIAMEMAAPDPDFDEIVEPMEMAADIPEPIVAEIAPPVAAEVPEPIAAEPAVAPHVEEPVTEAPIAMESLARLTDAIAEAAAEVMQQPAPAMAATATFGAALPMPSPLSEASLGATILASGMLQKPRAPANDALAPIRRMTQAEKIAFFS
jgi:YD repeat-containing protein